MKVLLAFLTTIGINIIGHFISESFLCGWILGSVSVVVNIEILQTKFKKNKTT